MTKTRSQKERAKKARDHLSITNNNKIGKKKQVARKDAPLAKASAVSRAQRVRESRAPDGSRRITFKEYVQDISGATTFTPLSFPVQPGIPTLFAWLSTQALAYQEYEMDEMAFSFESEQSANEAGKVMLAWMQDPSDPLPASKQEMLENQYKAKCKTWEDCSLRIPRSVLQREAVSNRRFIRSGALAANLDIKMYDLGQLIVGVAGQDSTDLVGELYVEYTVVLHTPLVSAKQQAIATSLQITGSGSVTNNAQFGTSPTYLGGLSVTAASKTLTFNRVGNYMVTLDVTGTSLSTTYQPTFSGTATTTAGSGFSNAASGAGTRAVVFFFVAVTARGQTCIIDLSAISVGTISACTGYVANFAYQ